MYRIAINGINSKAGGGKSILFNYMKMLNQEKLEDWYFLLTTECKEFDWISNNNIDVINLPQYYAKSIFAPFVYEILIDSILNKNSIDIVFNLGALVINTGIRQVYLFQWPYAIYPGSPIWKQMALKDWFGRKVKLHLLQKRLHRPAVAIAQTQVAKRALETLYGLTSVEIVPNSAVLDNTDTSIINKFSLPSGTKLLYLTHYYPHKNLEIFIPLARRIKAARCDYKIIITISAGQHPKAAKLLQDIKDQSLDNIIINVGPISMADVPSLYRHCDGLLMPTLLESFSGTYVEAMSHEIPIFTSNLDFAKAVCADAACYFDPHDPDDILSKLDNVLKNTCRIKSLINTGRRVLSNLLDWPQVFSRYQEILRTELERIPTNPKIENVN